MRIFRLLPVLCALALVVGAYAVPGVLIVQENVPNDSFGNPNVAVGNLLASELEKEGVFAPVVWTLTDPIFRTAVNEGLIKNVEAPSIAQAQAAASKLKLEYVIVVRLYQNKDRLLGRVQLFKGGKLIWKDPDKATAQIDSDQKIEPVISKDSKGREVRTYKPAMTQLEDRPLAVMGREGLLVDDTAASMVRTWVAFMKTGPFKGQSFSPKILVPDASPGQTPTIPNEAMMTHGPVKVDNKQLLADLDGLIKGGQAIQAILILRDAVDSAPQDLERRLALVRTLLLVEQPELAAKEARRAAELLPDRIELRAMAARAWMRAGREDEAMADLNEAVARDPNSVETRTLLAEVNLSKGRPQQALEHVDAVLKEKPTADQWFRRAQCNALLGNKDDVLTDLAKAKELGLSLSPQDVAARHVAVVEILDKSVTSLGNDLRSLMQRAQVRRTDPEVAQGAADLKNKVLAWSAFLGAAEPPKLHRSSQDRRVLAFNLLSQCLTDLGTFIASNDEDALAESRITLGEALKQYATAQASYRAEIGGTAKIVGSE